MLSKNLLLSFSPCSFSIVSFHMISRAEDEILIYTSMTSDNICSIRILFIYLSFIFLTSMKELVTHHVKLFVTPWTAAHQAPLSLKFSRQEYWSGWPFLSPGDLPNPGIEPSFLASPALAGGFFTAVPRGKPHLSLSLCLSVSLSRILFPLLP